MHDPARSPRIARWTLLGVAVALLPTRPAPAAPPEPGWVSLARGLEVRGIASLRITGKGNDEVWYASVRGRGLCSSKGTGPERGKWKASGTGIDAAVSGRDHHEITVDPKDEKTLYDVVRGKIYKSTNGGTSWEAKGSGTGTFSLDRRHTREWIAGVEIDPSKTQRLLAGTRARGFFGGLFESDNGGETWTQIAGTGIASLEKSGLSHDAWPISLDARSDKHVVVGGAHGSVWSSDDRGRHFKRTDPLGAGPHVAYDMTPIRNREVLLAEGRGLFRSRDAGETWGKEAVLRRGPCIAVEVDPLSPKRTYAIVRGDGLHHTEDAGRWPATPGKHLETDPHDVVCHPRSKHVVYLTSLTTGLWESTDKGETFTAVPGDLPTFVPPITLVGAHPADARRMVALTEAGSVFFSQDRGATWARVGNLAAPISRLFGDPASPTSWVAAGPKLWTSADSGATWTVAKEPPDPEDRIVDVQRLPDGLLVLWERDGRVDGKTPSSRPTASKTSWAQALAVDPNDAKHWIVAMRPSDDGSEDEAEGGAYETRDAGTTWARLEVAKGVANVNRGRVAAIDDTGAAWYGAEGAGLYRRDAEKDSPWVDVTPTVVAKPWWINAFLVSPGPGGVVEAVLQAESAFTETRNMLRTNDGGKTWTPMKDPGARLASLSVDPSVPGRYLAGDVSGDLGVLVYDVPGGAPPPEPAPSTPVAKPPEGANAPESTGLLGAATSADGSASVFDARAGNVLHRVAGGRVGLFAVAISPEGGVYAGGADRTIRAWDPFGKNRPVLAGHEGAVTALAASRDGSRLYSGDNQWRIHVWDLAAGKEVGRLEGHTGAVNALALSADGSRLYSASSDGTARVWDTATSKEVARAAGHEAEVLCLALSPDGATLYTGSRGPSVRAFDAATGEARSTLESGLPTVLALAAGRAGALYAAGPGDGVRVLGPDGKAAATLSAPGPVLALASSPDGGAILAGSADGSVRVFDADGGEPRWTSPAQGGPVLAVALSANGVGTVEARPLPSEGPGSPPSAPESPSPPPDAPAPSNPPPVK